MAKKVKLLEEYYSQFPEWYWTRGLHDAEIISFKQMSLSTDWKSKNPRYNCLEICFNSSGAMTKLKRIEFYNYSLKMEFDINTIEKPWWMGDNLTRLADGRFLLDITVEDAKGKKHFFSVSFEDIEVE